MKTTAIILIVCIPIMAILFNLIDGASFPDSLGLALDLVQFLALLYILERLNNENPTP